jgi:hypothetical protein
VAVYPEWVFQVFTAKVYGPQVWRDAGIIFLQATEPNQDEQKIFQFDGFNRFSIASN